MGHFWHGRHITRRSTTATPCACTAFVSSRCPSTAARAVRTAKSIDVAPSAGVADVLRNIRAEDQEAVCRCSRPAAPTITVPSGGAGSGDWRAVLTASGMGIPARQEIDVATRHSRRAYLDSPSSAKADRCSSTAAASAVRALITDITDRAARKTAIDGLFVHHIAGSRRSCVVREFYRRSSWLERLPDLGPWHQITSPSPLPARSRPARE